MDDLDIVPMTPRPDHRPHLTHCSVSGDYTLHIVGALSGSKKEFEITIKILLNAQAFIQNNTFTFTIEGDGRLLGATL